jgi:biopolymer transport protein ExbD
MSAAIRTDEEGMFAGINVTPLVDIVLVLLIIFMVTAKLIVSQTLPMDLPRAATGGEQQIVFAVAMNAAGETTVDARKVDSDQELLDLATSAKASHPDLRAVIHADAAVSHGRVVRVMDLLKQGGVGRIAFGVTAIAPENGAK